MTGPNSKDDKNVDGHEESTLASSSFDGNTSSAPSSIRRTLTSKLICFWFDDLPPLYGPLRITFYLSILAIMSFTDWKIFDGSGSGSTFSATACQSSVDRMVHYRYLDFPMKIDAGIFGWALAKMNYNPEIFNCRLLSRSIRWGVFLSGIGAGGRAPRVIVAICWWTMFGLRLSSWSKSLGHSNNLAGVAMISLCFAENNLIDCWSVDSLLMHLLLRIRGSRTFSPTRKSSGISIGGAARKMVLVQAVIVMFCAGLHKLVSHGIPGWMDGGTVYRAVQKQKRWRSPFLGKLLSKHRFLATILASTSVIGEIGSVATLLSPWWRPFGVASFVLFHLGIWLVMKPNFVINIATYVLLVDWRSVGCRICYWLPVSLPINTITNTKIQSRVYCAPTHLSQPTIKNREYHTALSTDVETVQHAPYVRIGAWAYTLVSALLLTTSLLRSDFFPFYSWSLYSWHPSEASPPFTIQTASESAQKCMTSPPLNPSCLNLGGSRHHDAFARNVVEEYEVVMVVKENSSENGRLNGKCGPDEFSAYRRWKPHSCWPNTTDPKKILRNLSDRNRKKTRPKPLKRFRNTSVLKGLEWRIIDSVAASIDEGPACFEPRVLNNTRQSSPSVLWDANPSPLSPASRLARRFRQKMSIPFYIGKDREIVAVGIFFRFLDESSEKSKQRYCLLGSSTEEEDTVDDSLNYIVGEIGVDRPFGNWRDVAAGILLTTAFAAIILTYLGHTQDIPQHI